ncbi:uncharacterized protein LOC129918413 [Episyrphus balteatus]|uniref:uncharacterized protein LOC129918413 n=1 Tax=Episyrphus balteatus TaxID=286459 RepID=UPI0024858770|nr:uncharacterized protein LOC129918413 [Episyrphus balteatus]
MPKMWPGNLTEALITKYQSYPQLWDTSSPYYSDKIKRQFAIQDISRHLDVSESAVKAKIHNLRTQYFQEVRKMKQKKNGIYGIKWRYFDDLKFISPPNDMVTSYSGDTMVFLSSENETQEENEKPPIKIQPFKMKKKRQRESSSSYNNEVLLKNEIPAIELSNDDAFHEIEDNTPSTSQDHRTTKMKKHSESYVYDEEVLFEKAQSANDYKSVDDFQVFGDYIASEFRVLKSNRCRMLLRRKIQKAILDVSEMDDLEESSSSYGIN